MSSEEKPFKEVFVKFWNDIIYVQCICKTWDRDHCLPAHKCLYGFNSCHIHFWILFLHTCNVRIYNNLSGKFYLLIICLQLYSVCFGFCPDTLRLFLWRSTSKEIPGQTVISDSPLVSSFSLSSSSMSNSDSRSSYSTFSSSSLKSGANALQFSYHYIR